MNSFDPKQHWENILSERYGLHGTGFRSLGKNYNNWMYKVKLKTFTRAVSFTHIQKFNTLKVIDIGSGTGFFVDAWKRLGVKSVTGIDITTVAIQKLKEKFPYDKFYQFDIGDTLTLSEQEQYDIVSSFDVLYHIVDDNRFNNALKNIYRLLHPGGFFIFSDNFLHRKTVRSMDQVSRSLTEIEQIISDTGFKIIRRIPEFVIMNNPIDSNSLSRLLWLIMMLPVEKSERIGSLMGACLFPIECFLTSFLKESPTLEIMICKKLDR